MKMKLTLVVVAAAVGLFVSVFPGLGLYAVGAVFVVFLLYGIARSASGKLDPMNDVPNALRILMAALGAYLFVTAAGFLWISSGILLFVGSILLNDEYQRRALDSVLKGRSGGAVAILGIDGSGKSTHTAELEQWFKGRGYYCTRVPFHRYLLVERLTSRRRGDKVSLGRRRGGNPLRPLVSVFDNLAFHILSSFGRGVEGRVILYDRYIWSTYVKYQALGYPVRPIRWLYLLPSPKFAVVLDIPVERSLGVIASRPDHIRYRSEVLSQERDEYLSIAREKGYPVLDATRDARTVEAEIEGLLSGLFPKIGGPSRK